MNCLRSLALWSTCALGVTHLVANDQPTGFWSGEAPVDITINVTDITEDSPVCGANIWLVSGSKERIYTATANDARGLTVPRRTLGCSGRTNQQGIATVKSRFDTQGSITTKDGEITRTGYLSISGQIEVTRDGYEPFAAALQDLVTAQELPLGENHIVLAIKLTKTARSTDHSLPQSANARHCGLGDPKFMITALAAEHYVAFKRWPVSKEELVTQAMTLLEIEEPSEALNAMFQQFEALELRTTGRNLVIHLRLIDDKQDFTLALQPASTVEEIVQNATESKRNRDFKGLQRKR